MQAKYNALISSNTFFGISYKLISLYLNGFYHTGYECCSPDDVGSYGISFLIIIVMLTEQPKELCRCTASDRIVTKCIGKQRMMLVLDSQYSWSYRLETKCD